METTQQQISGKLDGVEDEAKEPAHPGAIANHSERSENALAGESDRMDGPTAPLVHSPDFSDLPTPHVTPILTVPEERAEARTRRMREREVAVGAIVRAAVVAVNVEVEPIMAGVLPLAVRADAVPDLVVAVEAAEYCVLLIVQAH